MNIRMYNVNEDGECIERKIDDVVFENEGSMLRIRSDKILVMIEGMPSDSENI